MTKNTPRSKVARLIEKYNLGNIGDELERKWTRNHDRVSLRKLADEFNKQLLRNTLDTDDSPLLEGEVDNLYRLLTDDDVTSGMRQQARNRLSQQGVNVEQLEDDFVTYQSVRTYLKKYRDVSAPKSETSPEEQRQKKLRAIQRLISRLTDITEQSLSELINAGYLTLGDFNIVVTVRVHCTDCNTQRSVSELLSEGHCDCRKAE